jgi:hypothetical protein
MKEKLMELFKGLDSKLLTEDFQNKIEGLFEAAVNAAVASKKEELKEELIEETRNELNEFKENMIEKNAQYADMIAKNYLNEKCDDIETEMKKKLFESIVTGIVEVFKTYGVNLPEKASDLAEGYKEEKEEIKSQLDEVVEENISLKEENLVLRGRNVWQEKTKDLALDQEEELKQLMEDVEFDDEEGLARKIDIMKNSFLNEDNGTSKKKVIKENLDDEDKPLTSKLLESVR